MAQEAASSVGTRTLWRRLRGVPLLVALAAAFNEAGINTVAAATAVTLAVPLTATAFVYEVQALRGAQLEREAFDRSRHDLIAVDKPSGREGLSNALEPRDPDVAVKLDSMLASRSALLDTFGDEAAAVAPVYTRIIKQMLKDDESTFALLKAKREDGGQAPPPPVREKETVLRAVHERLAHLVGS